MPESDEVPEAEQNTGSWTAGIIIGSFLVLGALFTLYVLLWDGGAHT